MNRNQVVAGLSVTAMGILLVSKFNSLIRIADTPDPVKHVYAQGEDAIGTDAMDALIHSFTQSASAADRPAALASLLDNLESDRYADEKITGDLGEEFAAAVVKTVAGISDDSKDSIELRRRAVAILSSRDSAPSSKEFVIKTIGEGSPEMRSEALGGVGKPGGVRGPEVFAAVDGVARKGEIDLALPGALRRTGGNKAKKELVTLINSTDNVKFVNACAVALQDYRDPVLLDVALTRIDALGRLGSNSTPWIGKELFNQYLAHADAVQLRRGITVMSARPSLADVTYLKPGMESSDMQTRRLAAIAVRKAVLAKTIDFEQGVALLQNRLTAESEPSLKAELMASLQGMQQSKDSAQPSAQ